MVVEAVAGAITSTASLLEQIILKTPNISQQKKRELQEKSERIAKIESRYEKYVLGTDRIPRIIIGIAREIRDAKADRDKFLQIWIKELDSGS